MIREGLALSDELTYMLRKTNWTESDGDAQDVADIAVQLASILYEVFDIQPLGFPLK